MPYNCPDCHNGARHADVSINEIAETKRTVAGKAPISRVRQVVKKATGSVNCRIKS